MNNQSFNNEFDHKAIEWDNDPIRVKRAQIAAHAIESYIPLNEIHHALDFGSGTGLLSFALKDKINHLDCLDTSRGMIDVLQQKIDNQKIDNISGIFGSLAHPKLNQYDLIFSMLVLHHVDDLQSILFQFYEKLKTPGYLCLIDLFEEDGSFHGEDFHGHRGFNPAELEKILSTLGFSGIHYEHCFDIVKSQLNGGEKKFPVFILKAEKSALKI